MTLRSEKSNTRLVIILSIPVVLLFFASVYLGEFLLPFSAAAFALLVACDNGKRIASFACAALGAILVFLPIGFVPIWSLVSVILGFVLYLTYKYSFSKCDSAILLTVITSVAMVASFFILAFEAIGVWNLSAAVEFYLELKETLKHEFVSNVMSMYSVIPDYSGVEITSEYVELLFDSFVSMLISLIVIVSFVLVGIMLKTFCAVARRFAAEEEPIHEWRFETNVVYAYFYIAVYVISVFVEPESVIGITLANVVSILSFVFAYMGIKFTIDFFAHRGKKGLGKIAVVALILLLSSLAFDMLAVIGAVATVFKHKKSTDFGNPTNGK
jgi:hypothetical protein